jgi:hypothetical protein
MITKKFLKILIICFWLSISYLVFYVLLLSLIIYDYSNLEYINSNTLIVLISSLLGLSYMFLFCYSIYFYFKYDKYSKSGLYFLLFHFFYSLVYFYKVIWKRKRELINSYEPNHEPVLGNTIFIEEEIYDETIN